MPERVSQEETMVVVKAIPAHRGNQLWYFVFRLALRNRGNLFYRQHAVEKRLDH